MRHYLTLLVLLLLPGATVAAIDPPSQAVIADLSKSEIRIDSRFTGASLVLFGARNVSGDVVVVLRGPNQNFTIRKKERVGGIWMNTEKVRFKNIPQFYAVATNRDNLQPAENPIFPMLMIGKESLLPATLKGVDPDLLTELKEAFLKRQVERQLYHDAGTVTFVEDTLFKTFIAFPDTIPRGRYLAEVYLFNGKELAGAQTTPLQVYKSGLEAFISDLAHRHSAVYGVVAVLIALFSGWLASTLFDRFYV